MFALLFEMAQNIFWKFLILSISQIVHEVWFNIYSVIYIVWCIWFVDIHSVS